MIAVAIAVKLTIDKTTAITPSEAKITPLVAANDDPAANKANTAANDKSVIHHTACLLMVEFIPSSYDAVNDDDIG